MNVLIATPAYGGMVTTKYTTSLMKTVSWLGSKKIGYSTYLMSNESLIQRARNKLANYALEKKFDKLFFIDADLGWTQDDFARVLRSEHGVVGGTYPLKMTPIRLNYNLDVVPKKYIEKTHDSLKAYAQEFGDKAGQVQVRHIPTGFMCIDLKVLQLLKDKVGTYDERDARTNVVTTYYDFFPVMVRDNRLMSEDWMFCELCRDNDVPIYLNSTVVCDHVGSYAFSVRG